MSTPVPQQPQKASPGTSGVLVVLTLLNLLALFWGIPTLQAAAGAQSSPGPHDELIGVVAIGCYAGVPVAILAMAGLGVAASAVASPKPLRAVAALLSTANILCYGGAVCLAWSVGH